MVYAQGNQGSQQFGQGPGQGYGGQLYGQDNRNAQQQFNQGSNNRQQVGQATGNRFQERAALRRQLRQVGFQNIRILDAAYLVQARTPDGRGVLMVVDPSPETGAMEQMSQQGPRSRNQQFGQMGGQMNRMDQRSGMMGRSQNMDGLSSGQQNMPQEQMDLNRRGERATGSVSGDIRINESQVRSMLQERGLSNIQNLERTGNTYTASADWQGEQIDLRVNATTGEITQPGEL